MKNRLQKLRWERNWSQDQLSMISGVNRSVIASIEAQIVMNPTVETALLLAKAFRIPVEDIFILD